MYVLLPLRWGWNIDTRNEQRSRIPSVYKITINQSIKQSNVKATGYRRGCVCVLWMLLVEQWELFVWKNQVVLKSRRTWRDTQPQSVCNSPNEFVCKMCQDYSVTQLANESVLSKSKHWLNRLMWRLIYFFWIVM